MLYIVDWVTVIRELVQRDHCPFPW